MLKKWKKEKTILVDCDGVLLDWEYAFDNWMARHGYRMNEGGENEYNVLKKYKTRDAIKLVRMFNESAWIRKLPPLRDAMKYVRKLHVDHGYVFHAISSLSDDAYSQHLRTKNLRELFGDTVFEKYIYLDTGAPKHDALAVYEGTGLWWIEDKPENVDLGIEKGLSSVLIAHAHNTDYQHPEVPRLEYWKDVYDLITQS